MDGESGWWITRGKIGLPPLARVMGMGRQQHELAKRGASMQQENLPITIKEKKTIIKNMFRVQTIHDDYNNNNNNNNVFI